MTHSFEPFPLPDRKPEWDGPYKPPEIEWWVPAVPAPPPQLTASEVAELRELLDERRQQKAWERAMEQLTEIK